MQMDGEEVHEWRSMLVGADEMEVVSKAALISNILVRLDPTRETE